MATGVLRASTGGVAAPSLAMPGVAMRGVAAAIAATLVLSACGGRSANPVALVSTVDFLLTCDDIDAERAANVERVADLEDERNANRARSAGRIATSIFGNPLSAVALFDLSTAIYQEIGAIEARNDRLNALEEEKNCGEVEAAPQERPPVVVWSEDRRRIDEIGAYEGLAAAALAGPEEALEPLVTAPEVQEDPQDDLNAGRADADTGDSSAQSAAVASPPEAPTAAADAAPAETTPVSAYETLATDPAEAPSE